MFEITVKCDKPGGCKHNTQVTFQTDSSILQLVSDISAMGAKFDKNLSNFFETCLKTFRQIPLNDKESKVKWCCLHCLADAMKQPYEEIKADHEKNWQGYNMKDSIALILGN